MKLLCFGLLVGVLSSACGGSSSPAMPAPSGTTNLAGSWAGTSTDSSGQEKMAWTVTQDGSSMTGTMNFSDTGRGMMGNGAMRGTINGRTVTFHMDIGNGGFSGPMSSCSMSMDGQATLSDDGRTMTGTYSGGMSGMMSGGMMNQPCGGAVSNGHFTLTR